MGACAGIYTKGGRDGAVLLFVYTGVRQQSTGSCGLVAINHFQLL